MRLKYFYNKFKVWDLKKGVLSYTMYGHNAEINTVSFSKKGDFFATGGADSNIFIWKSAFCKSNG